MTSLVLPAVQSVRSQRGFLRAIAAVASAVETVLEVFAEAESGSAAARERFPLAD